MPDPPITKKSRKSTNRQGECPDSSVGPSVKKYWNLVKERVTTDEKGAYGCYGGDKHPVSISYDGKRVAIGSYPFSEEGIFTVKVCDFDGVRWNEEERFSHYDAYVDDGYFGRRIALSGNGKRLAIEHSNKLCVDVYENEDGIGWKALGKILHGGKELSISADGGRIAVGRCNINDVTVVYQCNKDIHRKMVRAIVGEADWGAIILDFLGVNWEQMGQPICEGLTMDVSLSADGKTIAVGSLYGYAKVFQYSLGKGNWVQVGQKLIGKKIVQFGWPLSINAQGNIIAVGSESRQVKVFQLHNNNWKSMKSVLKKNLYGFTASVCIAPNTNRLAVGPHNWIGGSVDIYDYDGKKWVPVGNLTSQPNEVMYGSSVSFSSCGNRLAVGSAHKDYMDVMASKGCLSVYEYG